MTKQKKIVISSVSLAAIAVGTGIALVFQPVIHENKDGWSTQRLERALELVDESDPIGDAEAQLAIDDYRFAGCWGEPGGPFFPGIPYEYWDAIREAEDYWAFEGTTDYIEGSYHSKLIDRAWQYAEPFNRVIWERRKTHYLVHEPASRH